MIKTLNPDFTAQRGIIHPIGEAGVFKEMLFSIRIFINTTQMCRHDDRLKNSRGKRLPFLYTFAVYELIQARVENQSHRLHEPYTVVTP